MDDVTNCPPPPLPPTNVRWRVTGPAGTFYLYAASPFYAAMHLEQHLKAAGHAYHDVLGTYTFDEEPLDAMPTQRHGRDA